jgi:hypothetical protein
MQVKTEPFVPKEESGELFDPCPSHLFFEEVRELCQLLFEDSSDLSPMI